MVFVKNLKNFYLSISDKIGFENAFYVILERKNASLNYKNKKLKKSEKLGISKGVLYNILQRKNTSLDYKKEVKKPKGVSPWF